jgi:hypothetical protein
MLSYWSQMRRLLVVVFGKKSNGMENGNQLILSIVARSYSLFRGIFVLNHLRFGFGLCSMNDSFKTIERVNKR